jgi:hypothetical protein
MSWLSVLAIIRSAFGRSGLVADGRTSRRLTSDAMKMVDTGVGGSFMNIWVRGEEKGVIDLRRRAKNSKQLEFFEILK